MHWLSSFQSFFKTAQLFVNENSEKTKEGREKNFRSENLPDNTRRRLVEWDVAARRAGDQGEDAVACCAGL